MVCLGCFLAACGGSDSSSDDDDIVTNTTNVVDKVTEPQADITTTGGPVDDAPAAPSVPRSGVLAVGDSITAGFQAESWALKLARFRGVQVFRRAIGGERAGTLARRIGSDLDETNAAMVLILSGTNDARSNSSGGGAFESMIDTALGKGVTVLIGTIPPEFAPEPEPEPDPDPTDPDPTDPDPTDPDPTDPDPTDPDPTDPTDPIDPTDPDPTDPADPPEGSNTASRVSFALAKNTARVNAVNANIRAAAASRGVRLVEVHAAFGNNPALMQEDGYHPNDAGQNVIAVTFGEALQVLPRDPSKGRDIRSTVGRPLERSSGKRGATPKEKGRCGNHRPLSCT